MPDCIRNPTGNGKAKEVCKPSFTTEKWLLIKVDIFYNMATAAIEIVPHVTEETRRQSNVYTEM